MTKRYRSPQHVGAGFNVRVCDGNVDEWFHHGVSPALGGAYASHNPEITAEQAQEIENALVAALEFWRWKRPRGPATVTRLPVKEPL